MSKVRESRGVRGPERHQSPTVAGTRAQWIQPVYRQGAADAGGPVTWLKKRLFAVLKFFSQLDASSGWSKRALL